MRAAPAAASSPWSARARRKCPRWLVANCSSHPCGVRCCGVIMTPALLTRMSSGPRQVDAKAATDAGSVTSRAATATSSRPVVAAMSLAVLAPASVLRTARVTWAPAPASARAVSMPIPDDAPVTMARLPVRSMPATTSAAVEEKSNGVVIGVMTTSVRGERSAARSVCFLLPYATGMAINGLSARGMRPDCRGTTVCCHGTPASALLGHDRRRSGPPAVDRRAVETNRVMLMPQAITARPTATALERLANEQAALPRIAALVAREAAEPEVFAVIAEELARLLGVDDVQIWRYEGDTPEAVASAGAFDRVIPVGMRERLPGDSRAARALEI